MTTLDSGLLFWATLYVITVHEINHQKRTKSV